MSKDPLQDALAKLDIEAEKLAKERAVAKTEKNLKIKENKKVQKEKDEEHKLERKIARDDRLKSRIIFFAAIFVSVLLVMFSVPPEKRPRVLEYSIYIIGFLAIAAMKAKKH